MQFPSGLTLACSSSALAIHGKSQRHRLKDDCMLGFVLVGVFGHLVIYKNDSLHELCCC